jgi:hypothetical protein
LVWKLFALITLVGELTAVWDSVQVQNAGEIRWVFVFYSRNRIRGSEQQRMRNASHSLIINSAVCLNRGNVLVGNPHNSHYSFFSQWFVVKIFMTWLTFLVLPSKRFPPFQVESTLVLCVCLHSSTRRRYQLNTHISFEIAVD